jgi:hypothetical protein
MGTYTEASRLALANLRSPEHFQWYVIPIFALVVYTYAVEIERKNWNVVLAGLAFYGLEFFIEAINGLILHFTQHSALWTAPSNSAFLLTVGLNIEITFIFAFAGLTFAKMLPADKNLKILGLNNRTVIAIGNAVFCVLVEIVLNRWDALIWEYWFWSARFPLLIVIFGYSLYMFFSFWVHDMDDRKRQIRVVAGMWAISAATYLVFMGILGWI